MMAFASVSGGAIFVPEGVVRATQKGVSTSRLSYKDLLQEEAARKQLPVFGKKKPAKDQGQKAA
jgi:hypothetical protein